LKNEAAKLNLNSARSNSNYNLKQANKLPPTSKPPQSGRTRKEDDDNESKPAEAKSNIFTPLSVRSSIDEYEVTSNTRLHNRQQLSPSNVSSVKKPSGLDLFFQSIEKEKANELAANSKQNSVRTITSEELNVINPIKDEKLTKLITSTDNLRKQLQFDTLNNTSGLNDKRLEQIRRNVAARKIQKWYKKKNEKNRQDELNK
jgi:hypothetical protein